MQYHWDFWGTAGPRMPPLLLGPYEEGAKSQSPWGTHLGLPASPPSFPFQLGASPGPVPTPRVGLGSPNAAALCWVKAGGCPKLTYVLMTGQPPSLLMPPTPAWWLAQATQNATACPRELPKRKYPREESEAGEEVSTDKWAPVSKQEKQLLTDCLTTIIR